MAAKSSAKSKAAKQRGWLDEGARFDVRLRNRNLRDGILTRSEINKYLKSLPDMSSKAEDLVSDARGPGRTS